MSYNVLLIAVMGSNKHRTSSELVKSLGMQEVLQAAVYRDTTPMRFPPHLRASVNHIAVGEWGCSLAHHDCWRRIVAENKSAIIFEDDIALSIDPSDARRMVDETLKTHHCKDIVFLGYWGLLTTHAYHVTPTGASKLLAGSHMESYRVPVPVDHHIKTLCQQGVLTYAHAPNTCNTRETEFDGVIKQLSTRKPGLSARQRFTDVR